MGEGGAQALTNVGGAVVQTVHLSLSSPMRQGLRCLRGAHAAGADRGGHRTSHPTRRISSPGSMAFLLPIPPPYPTPPLHPCPRANSTLDPYTPGSALGKQPLGPHQQHPLGRRNGGQSLGEAGREGASWGQSALNFRPVKLTPLDLPAEPVSPPHRAFLLPEGQGAPGRAAPWPPDHAGIQARPPTGGPPTVPGTQEARTRECAGALRRRRVPARPPPLPGSPRRRRPWHGPGGRHRVQRPGSRSGHGLRHGRCGRRERPGPRDRRLAGGVTGQEQAWAFLGEEPTTGTWAVVCRWGFTRGPRFLTSEACVHGKPIAAHEQDVTAM